MIPGAGINLKQPKKQDLLERFSRLITLVTFALAVITFIATPILALTWIHMPFPGFFVEQTLVVNDNNDVDWSGWKAGITYLQHVIRVGGVAVTNPTEFHTAIASYRVGQTISVFTVLPDGSTHLYPYVALSAFSTRDLIRFFWLPYLVGLAYLGIGIWIYLVAGQAPPGRALAFFCFLTSIACSLIFDLSTTHMGSVIWTAAIALLAGALISLAMRFPVEWTVVHNHRWLLGVPYCISVLLITWNLLIMNSTSHPWSYISSWGANYRFAAVGIGVFLGVMIYRAVTSEVSDVRRQARVVLLGSSLAFIPLALWFIAPLFHIQLHFNVSIFLPPLILFPLSTGIAIFRYRLWEVDSFVNRTIVYGLLTAVLGGLYTASIALSQRLFVAFTGEKSDAAIVITTLIVGSAFTPVKTRLQIFVDQQFKEHHQHNRELGAFGEQIRSFNQMNDIKEITHRLLEESIRCLHAENGAITLLDGSEYKILHTIGQWKGDVKVSIPIECDHVRYGFLWLGPRIDGSAYTQEDSEILQQVVKQVAYAIKQIKMFINPPQFQAEQITRQPG